MANFRYIARSPDGNRVEGSTDAESVDIVASRLSNAGHIPIEIIEEKQAGEVATRLEKMFFKRPPGVDDLLLFSRQMYTLVRSGVPLGRAMNGLAETIHNAQMREALDDIVDSLMSGRDLAAALASHSDIFPALYISLIQVGEQSGRLDEAFLQVAEYLEMEKQTRMRIKSATRYPTIVVAAVAIAIAIINLFVIPAFAKVFASFKAELPLPTRILIATSDFTVNYWYVLLAGLLALYFGIKAYVRTDAGQYQWDRYKLRIPVAGDIILRATIARFTRSFAMAYESGVPIIQALSVVARAVGNRYVEDKIINIRNGIERGDTLTRTAASSKMFTPLVIQMLAVGEETGQVDEMLKEVSGYYEREVDYDLKNLSALLEPMLTIAVGGLVLVLALGVFLPMWNLASAIQGGG